MLIPFAVPLTVILGGAAIWPFFEQWATGDKSCHHVNDRPRNAPVRTATGVAAMTFYGVLWIEGANDVIADKLQIPLYTITWITRVVVFAGPALAFVVTRRVCLGLQRKDNELLEHGLETGIVKQLPSGEFAETRRPLDEEKRAVIEAKEMPVLMPPPGSQDKHGVPAPASCGALGWARAIANRAFAQTVVFETNGHGNGHRAGAAGEHVAVGPADDRRAEDGLTSPAQQAPGGNPGQRPPG